MATLKPQPTFVVDVIHEDGVWIASCDDLGLTTEAKTYEELIERVALIAPEMCVENNLCSSDVMRIEFVHEQTYGNDRIAL